MKATRSLTPLARMEGLPELVDSVEIGHCILAIQALQAMAHDVRDKNIASKEVAEVMSYLILEIERALQPQLENKL